MPGSVAWLWPEAGLARQVAGAAACTSHNTVVASLESGGWGSRSWGSSWCEVKGSVRDQGGDQEQGDQERARRRPRGLTF